MDRSFMIVKKKSTSGKTIVKKKNSGSESSSAVSRVEQIFDNWITKKLLALHLGMSISFVNKYMKEGLPFRRRGRAVRFRVIEVEEWLQRRFIQ
jgi:predicted DNA-binding transcriptional regulator AlpA